MTRHRGRLRVRSSLVSILLFGLFGAPVWSQTVYIAFGDSITEGFGDSVPEGPDAGYPIRLEGLLVDSGRDAEVRNRGLSGERTTEGITRIDTVLNQNPDGDVLLLMEGTNDVSREISQETTVFNLDEMARKAENRGWEAIQGTLIPRLPNARIDRENTANQRLNQSVRNQAGTRNRRLVDNFEVFSTEPDVFARLYAEDPPQDPVGHPNPDGYDLMASIFFDVIVGIDRVPPVPGVVSPNNGDSGVSELATLDVDVWDFGAGIDLQSLQLVADGVTLAAEPGGSSERANLTYTPTEPWEGTVSVVLRARDLEVPPNSVNREIIRFTVQGAEPLVSDINRDGRVDGLDLIRLAVAFGSRNAQGPPGRRYDAAADLDANDVIDGDDLAILASDFGQDSAI